MILSAPTPVGDVLDRLTILGIKVERLPEGPRAAASEEHAALLAAWLGAGLPAPVEVPEYAALAVVNRALWDVEDRLRAAEARGDFGPAFVADARAVYRTNDRRAALKRAVNERFGSAFVEQKHHPHY
jgi:hypothetical protein